MLGLLNTDGKGRGILFPVCGKRIVRGIMKRHTREAPMMMAEPVQLHLIVSGTVGWTAACASSKIKLLKVLAPR